MARGILITGATGFVGARLVARLTGRASPLPIIGVARVAAQRSLAGLLAGERSVDLSEAFDLRKELRSTFAVVHLAARVHVMRDSAADPDAEFRSANAEATARLARQAAECGVRRFVFVSTIKVNGESTRGRAPMTGRDRPDPQDAYARSKAEGERALNEIARETGLDVVILRPPLIYGAGAKANFAAFVDLVARAPVLPFGGLKNRRSFLHVDHLANAIEAALRPDAPVGTYTLSDGSPVSTSEMARALADGFGRSPVSLRVPAWAFSLAARVGGRKVRGAIDRLTGDLEVDSSEFCRDFDWAAPRTTIEALRLTARDWSGRSVSPEMLF